MEAISSKAGESSFDVRWQAVPSARWGCGKYGLRNMRNSEISPTFFRFFRLLVALRGAPEGLSRSEISAVFGRHRSESEIDSVLRALAESGLAQPHAVETPGRAREVWTAKHAK